MSSLFDNSWFTQSGSYDPWNYSFDYSIYQVQHQVASSRSSISFLLSCHGFRIHREQDPFARREVDAAIIYVNGHI